MALTVGQIGAGHTAALYMQGYVAAPAVSAVVLAESDQDARTRLYQQFGIIKQVHDDYRVLLDDPEVPVVGICAPIPQRAEIAIAALDAGKHVICDRPPASTAAEFDAMVAAAGRNGRRLLISIPELMIPANEKARQLIHDGELGDVLLAIALLICPGPGCSSDGDGPGAPMGTGYGTIATLQRWLGPAASVSMAAPGDTDACSGPAETSALVNMQMCGGALAQIAVTVAAAPDQRTAERRVVGTKGSLLARDDPEDELPLVGFEGKVYFPIHVHNPPHVLQYATKQMICHLVECIARDKEPSVTIDETHAALQTLCAAYESHQRGLRVALA